MRKDWMYWILALPLAGACEKVNNLSDAAAVEQFTITAVQPADARVGEVTIEAGKIRVELLPREGLFPVTFKATTKVSRVTADVVNLPDEFRFEAGNSVERFYAIAASGTPHEYEVSLKAKDTGADILSFSLRDRTGDIVIIDPWKGAVRISAHQPRFPLDVTATLVLSNGTTVRDTVITFANVEDKKTLAVRSKEGSDRAWEISVEGPVQLANSDFERWINEGTNDVNVDPTPGKIWCTANNAIVRGTLPVGHAGGKAAEMTTGIQNVPLFNHQLVAAGTLYTGY
ncbi:MAG: PCMD domain-containing protein, partial [Odoribacteraceae bacterium]|nr:PCMD domain-containing protein [Odoribacteraceae bacterium]